MQANVDPVLAGVTRLALAALFGAAVLHKLRDVGGFTATLRAYRLMPDALVPAAVALVVAGEIGVTLVLVMPGTDPLGPVAAIALLSAYSGAIAVNLARGRREIDCGCLGPGRRQRLTSWLLARNALVALGAVLLLVPGSPRAWIWIDVVSLAGGLSMLVLLWSAAHRLAAVWPAPAAPGRLS
jgi:hypothetical protein